MQAARWFGEGRRNAWIAAELRVGLRQVEKWRQAWRQGGAGALRSKGPHRRQRLDDAMVARLEAELNRGPAAHGYADDQRWTLGRMAALIGELFAVDCTLLGGCGVTAGRCRFPDAGRSSVTTRPSKCGKSGCGRRWNHRGRPGRLDLFRGRDRSRAQAAPGAPGAGGDGVRG